MASHDGKKLKMRFFVLTFAISFFVLAMMGLIVVFTLNPTEESQVSSEITTDSFYLPKESDNLSVLFIGYSGAEKEPVCFVLARLDMLSGRIPVLLFPKETALSEDSDYPTLAQAYQKGGPSAAVAALSKSYSVPIDRYVDVDSQGIIDSINRIGVAEYQLSENLSYNENGIFISLSAGRQLVDGQKFYDILRYPAYPGGPLEQCREGANLISSYLNSRLTSLLSANSEALVTGLLGIVSTDISYVDFESRIAALSFLSKLSGDPAQPYLLTGAWNKAGLFIPDAAARRLLVQTFA